MNKNPMNKGILIENAIGIGTVTPQMVAVRARELATIAGRVPPQPSQVDYEQAKRELTGGPDMDLLEEFWNRSPNQKAGILSRLDWTPHTGVVRRRRG